MAAECSCGRGQQHPGLCEQECSQQVEGSDPSPLFGTSEGTSGAVCAGVGTKKTLTKRNKPSGGLQSSQGLQHTRYEERLRGVCSAQKGGSGRVYGDLQLPTGRVWRRWEQTLLRGAQQKVKRQRA